MKQPDVIRAAGVVLLRERADKTEVCLVHRPRHKDWSLPKGKLDKDEHPILAARREVLEETGDDVILGVPLPTQNYVVEGKPKEVRYWVGRVRPGGPGFKPDKEVDKIEWLSPAKAIKKLTYPRDAGLIKRALRNDTTSPLMILRHAKAMPRGQWRKKPDLQRPLAPAGTRNAEFLIALLDAFGIESVHSSDAVRCVDSVAPFADSIKARIRLEPLFSEEGFDPSDEAPLKRADQLLASPSPMVLCTHRPVLPDLIKHIARRLDLPAGDRALNPTLPTGGFIVIHRTFSAKRGVRAIAVERGS